MITSPLALAALIAAATALAFVLDRKVPLLSKVGASLVAIVLGALLSNFGLVPPDSPVYDVVGGPVTSLAIAWLLLSVNLGDLKKAGGRMLGAFGLAVTGTALGAFVGALLFGPLLGDDTWRLAGTLTGTYSGGSLNFVAVGRGLELPDRLFAGATAADNVTTGLWLGVVLLLPLWIGRFYPPVPGTREEGDEGHAAGVAAAERHGAGVATAERHGAGGAAPADTAPADTVDPGAPDEPLAGHPFFLRRPISTLDLSVLLATGVLLILASEAMGRWIPQVPSVLWLTTLALVVGHLPVFRTPRGALQLGVLALHFFFVVIGIHSRVVEIVAVGFEVFFYTLVVVGVHGVVVYGVGRLLRFDVGSLSVASQAAVGGPSTALAVAVSREWKGLVLPGIIVGLLGYALGNYLGFAVGYTVRGLGIGL